MIELLIGSTYFTIAIFIVGLFYVWFKWSSKPLHLRWELYPVPHESGRTHYGGSYMEEIDWASRRPGKSLVEELKEMLKEMLFLKRVYNYNRPLWYITFLFHGGIYLMLLWFALIVVNGLLSVYIGEAIIKALMLENVILVIGYIGIFSTTVGAVGLLTKRIFDPSLRDYSSRVDYFNLIFILTVLITGIAALSVDLRFTLVNQYMKSIVSFGLYLPEGLPLPTIVHLVSLQLLWIYIPYSKMSHFLGKWFSYHKILWDDERNIKGSKIESRVKEIVRGYKIPWSAPHMKKDKKWLENVLEVE
ncbi:MAG: respiratory nitrate reductase subunit gamma [Nitrososphaerota archaeon]